MPPAGGFRRQGDAVSQLCRQKSTVASPEGSGGSFLPLQLLQVPALLGVLGLETPHPALRHHVAASLWDTVFMGRSPLCVLWASLGLLL